MNVTIPVQGPSAEGELRCAAIKDSEGTWVVLVLEAHITRTSLHPSQLLKLQSGGANALEGGAMPDPASPPPSAADTAAAVQGGSTPVLVFDVMNKQWLNTTYVIGAETEFTKGEAQTAAKVIVVPPSTTEDDPPNVNGAAVEAPATSTAAPHSSGSTVQPPASEPSA